MTPRRRGVDPPERVRLRRRGGARPFFEHGTWNHGTGLHEEQIRVPLVIRGPGGVPSRVRHRVTIQSLPGTILRMAGFEPVPAMGTSGFLTNPLPGGDRPVRARLVPESAPDLVQLATIDRGRKWILTIEGEDEVLQCFDLEADPAENADIAAAHPAAAREVRDRMLRRSAKEETMRLRAGTTTLPPELVEDLRGLGYLR